MKKLIIAVSFLISLQFTVFAENNNDTAWFQLLQAVLKNVKDKISYNDNTYIQTVFTYHNHVITSYKDPATSEVSFFRQISLAELPQKSLDKIKRRFSNSIIEDALVYMNADGDIDYYAAIRTDKTYMALKIKPAGKISVCMRCSLK